jgi:hypothetical protein
MFRPLQPSLKSRNLAVLDLKLSAIFESGSRFLTFKCDTLAQNESSCRQLKSEEVCGETPQRMKSQEQ